MSIRQITIAFLALAMVGCNTTQNEDSSKDGDGDADIKFIGAMKNVMRKGDLSDRIHLDTISDKEGLYGLGPLSYLTGELLINNGKSYVSKVTSDSTMAVEQRFDVSAPFFVYANVREWTEVALPSKIKTIRDVEEFIDAKTSDFKRPFAFKLTGQIASADIHIQSLPEGTKVSSPEEAHQGQTHYTLNNEDAEIIGFFSTEHKGVFTHHDTFLHMHLITADESKMGHLDELEIGKMTLYLPEQ